MTTYDTWDDPPSGSVRHHIVTTRINTKKSPPNLGKKSRLAQLAGPDGPNLEKKCPKIRCNRCRTRGNRHIPRRSLPTPRPIRPLSVRCPKVVQLLGKAYQALERRAKKFEGSQWKLTAGTLKSPKSPSKPPFLGSMLIFRSVGVPKNQNSSHEMYPLGNDHISNLAKRKIMDSSWCLGGYETVPVEGKTPQKLRWQWKSNEWRWISYTKNGDFPDIYLRLLEGKSHPITVWNGSTKECPNCSELTLILIFHQLGSS